MTPSFHLCGMSLIPPILQTEESLVFLQTWLFGARLGQARLSFRGQFATLGDVLTGSYGVCGILKLPFPSLTLFPTPASPSHYQ